MNRIHLALAVALSGAAACAVTPTARAADDDKLVVVTSLPYLADIARAVGGDAVDVTALCPPGQDPHELSPTPHLAVVLGHAELYIENGLQLELWSERVIDSARNPNIRPGTPGYLVATAGIAPLEVPAVQSRAGGDVHPGGNPHMWLDPLNLKQVAANIATGLARVRPAKAAEFEARRSAFAQRMDDAVFGPELVKLLGSSLLERLARTGRLRAFLQEQQVHGRPLAEKAGGWLGRALALGDLQFVSYHQVWGYFTATFGLRCAGTIEEKPGIPPSPSYLDQLEAAARAAHVRVVEASPFYPISRAQGLAERLGVPAVVLPTQPGEEGTTDVFSMFDTICTRLEGAAPPAAPAAPVH